ncbi:MAG: flagellar hook assembly protein FlgD [Spirochaetaceae bacterium]|jgi:flagellar basal-body rod modification protein FlgD|nr:flagellar hook assembly protein FlgD [Spirochaetaceae bacterium]
MDINTNLSANEMAETNRLVNELNAKINEGRPKNNQSLGRDDFLKLLVTQLSYQDPTAPMEDKEFIAQMAQFSSLEQMTNMASDFSRLAEIITGSEANSAVGKSVELLEGDNVVQGTVKAVTRGGAPQVLVNGNYYQWSQVTKIFEE